MSTFATSVLAAAFGLSSHAAEYVGGADTGRLSFDMVASIHKIQGEARDFSIHFDVNDHTGLQGFMNVQAKAMTTHLAPRDKKMHGFCLAVDEYPKVVLKVRGASGDTDGLTAGTGSGNIVLDATLTIRNTTRPVAIDAAYAWQDDQLRLSGEHRIDWTDYGVPDPSISISTLFPEIQVSFDVALVPAG